MSNTEHHAIVVSAFSLELAEKARDKARSIFAGGMVSSTLVAPVNTVFTFMVGSDGSYENWSESSIGDDHRDQFVRWLKAQDYEDGSSPYTWVEMAYGHHERPDRVARNNRMDGAAEVIRALHSEIDRLRAVIRGYKGDSTRKYSPS